MKNKIIYKIKSGSHLYGINTSSSDEDYLGVYLNAPEELFGLHNSEILEDNLISKQENGRNNKDAIDCKYYELRKFVKLLVNNNPTIIEMLFASPENIIIKDELMNNILDNKDKFLSTKIMHSFLGYSFSQKQKSQVKTGNLKDLIEARNAIKLASLDNSSNMIFDYEIKPSIMSIDSYYNYDTEIKFKDIIIKAKKEVNNSYIQIADLKFTNQKLKDVYKKIELRINNASHRADGMLEKGFDTKFISHTYRLLLEGEELLTTGNLKFPLKDKDLLLDIRAGKIPITQIMDMIDKKEEDIKSIYGNSILQHLPDHKFADKVCIDIYKKFYGFN